MPEGFSSPLWHISDGTRRAGNRESQLYEPNAQLPREFREPTPEEIGLMSGRIAPKNKSFVAAISVAESIVAKFVNYYEAWKTEQPDEKVALDAIGDLIRATQPLLAWPTTVRSLGISEDFPEQPTVTKHTSGQYYDHRLGLHVDSWFDNDPEERLNAPTRICINLGPGHRWFLYIPYSVGLLHSKGFWNEKKGLISSELSVIRISVPPATLYIAPTESVLHDGSTLGSAMPSSKITFLGDFNVNPRLL